MHTSTSPNGPNGQAGELSKPQTAPIGPRAWVALGMLIVVYVLNFLSRQLPGILAKPIQDSLHVSDAAAGSPQNPAPTLSNSSSRYDRIPALDAAQRLNNPSGIAPNTVRRWSRISASSRMPPSEMRANLRPSASATLLPSEVLPTPGGPTRQRIGPLICLRL